MSGERMEFPGWPFYTQDEIDAVGDVLASGRVNYWTGPHGRAFEKEFAAYHGGGFAVALANGTVALEIALRGLGIGPGDDVVVPCRTFIATASAVVAVGARPVVADIDVVSGNITAAGIQDVLTSATRAVIVVHLGGRPCEMDELMALAEAHDLKLIEDCAQAIGAEYRGKKIGTFGDAAAFSFCQDKIVTTGGEGGMLLTADESLWKRAWSYKDHGKDMDKAMAPREGGSYIWLHDTFGSNARMTEMQAAIGRIQLDKLDEWIAQRRSNATVLFEQLEKTDGLLFDSSPDYMQHVYYRSYLRFAEDRLHGDWNRERIVVAISSQGVPCFQGSCNEIYREQAFARQVAQPTGRLAGALELDHTSFCLLCHPTLNEAHMSRMAEVVADVMQQAVR